MKLKQRPTPIHIHQNKKRDTIEPESATNRYTLYEKFSQAECTECGRWYRDGLKCCPYCEEPNEDNVLEE